MAVIKRLPIGYTEVEYLLTDGQQGNSTNNQAAWIDTGVIAKSTTKMECKCQFTSLVSGSGTEALFGTTSTGRFAWGFANISPNRNFYVGLGNQNVTTSVVRDTNAHVFVIDATNNTYAIDNTTGSFTTAGTLDCTIPVYLFGRSNTTTVAQNTVNKPANARVYYCKFWDNGVLIRNYIPCYRNSDNVYGLYDMVNDVFYTKNPNGTKSFSIGNVNEERMRLIYNNGKYVFPVFPSTANTKPMKMAYMPK